jgi:hemolysin-activating ACP:hemolysin acyltransferase
MAGQFRVAHAATPGDAHKEPQAGRLAPVALALWARVSSVVDKRLSSNLDKAMSLRPAEWVSGDIPWLMVVAGNPRAVPGFLKQLTDREFSGLQVKMRLPPAGA